MVAKVHLQFQPPGLHFIFGFEVMISFILLWSEKNVNEGGWTYEKSPFDMGIVKGGLIETYRRYCGVPTTASHGALLVLYRIRPFSQRKSSRPITRNRYRRLPNRAA